MYERRKWILWIILSECIRWVLLGRNKGNFLFKSIDALKWKIEIWDDHYPAMKFWNFENWTIINSVTCMQSSGEKMNKFGTVVLLQPESVKTQMKLKANLIVPDFTNVCVQQFIQFIFLTSFSLLYFLFPFIGIPKAG